MFEIKFEVNGRPVDAEHFGDAVGDAIEQAILRGVKNQITSKVGSVKCPDHGSAAKILAKGSDLSHLTLEVSGCCSKLIDEVKRKLAE